MFRHPRVLPLAILLFAAGAHGHASPQAFAEPESELLEQQGLRAMSSPPAPDQNPLRKLAELRSKLGHRDQMVAMRALHMALTQVPDGGTFVWKKESRSLKGMIRPSKAFRNAEGQICRHVIYALALGPFTKQIEGIACRQDDGRWQL